jgi:Bacterial-like globin
VPPAGFKFLVTEVLCWAAGGPQSYSGRAMDESHRHLLITAGEWQAFIDDVKQTLDKFAVPAAEQTEIKALVESTRRAIVVGDISRQVSRSFREGSSNRRQGRERLALSGQGHARRRAGAGFRPVFRYLKQPPL